MGPHLLPGGSWGSKVLVPCPGLGLQEAFGKYELNLQTRGQGTAEGKDLGSQSHAFICKMGCTVLSMGGRAS